MARAPFSTTSCGFSGWDFTGTEKYSHRPGVSRGRDRKGVLDCLAVLEPSVHTGTDPLRVMLSFRLALDMTGLLRRREGFRGLVTALFQFQNSSPSGHWRQSL